MPLKPLISIVTVNLDDFKGLQRTMKSVFSQTWKDFEFIVIDGGSTDGSKELIEENKNRIDHCLSEPDSGIYDAMNKGIRLASGEYLLFVNSGDHFLTDLSLQVSIDFLHTYDLIYFDLKVIQDEASFIKKYPDRLSFSYFLKDTLPHPATFIRSSLFQKFGYYDEDLKIVSDWKFFINTICRFNCTYFKIEKTLSVFYFDGLSSDIKQKQVIEKEKQKVLTRYFPLFLTDYKELEENRELICNLRKSRKINFLVKLGLLNKF